MNERGDITVEAAVGSAALVVLFGLVIVGMRTCVADAAIEEAARSAARAASIARDGVAAAAVARQRAEEVLAEQHLACTELVVSVDARDFTAPLGQTGFVVATVTCGLSYRDLGIPVFGGSKTVRAEFRSPIDRYGAQR